MRIGLALPHYDFSFPDERRATVGDVVAYARRAESLGFSSVWISDHLFLDIAKYGGPDRRFATPEAFVMLTAIAAATERVRLGPLVLNSSFRHPRMLVEQVKSLDELSGRRLDVGLGAGWYEPEFLSAGIPYGTAGQRIERMARVASMLDGLVNPRAPIWIGGKGGPKVMRVVAESADGWNVVWRMDPDTYRARLEVLHEACDRYRRDPNTVARSVGLYTLLARDDADLERRFERMRAWSRGVLDGVDLRSFADGGLVGAPAECAARIKEFEALGVSEIILALAPVPFAVWEDEQLELAAELIEAVA